MKKIIETLFNFIFAQPEDLKEDEKTPFWQITIILIFIGFMIFIISMVE